MAYFKDRVRALKEIYARHGSQLTQDEINLACSLYGRFLEDNIQGLRPNAESSLTEEEADWLLLALERMGADVYRPPPLPYKEGLPHE